MNPLAPFPGEILRWSWNGSRTYLELVDGENINSASTSS